MQVNRVATMKIETVSPQDSVYEIARKMSLDQVGFLPVVDNSRLVGVITDRDLVVRCLAENRNPFLTTGADVMTAPGWWVFEDDELDHAAQELVRKKVRRLVVKNHLDGAVGVITLDDIAKFTQGDETSGRILREVAKKPPVGVAVAMSAFDYEE